MALKTVSSGRDVANNAAAGARAVEIITVVIPAFRAERTIRRAIESALTQCSGNVRIIVVTDDQNGVMEKVVRELSDDRITLLINETNLGAPVSRNRGLAAATTDFICFLDADDFYEGDVLQPLIDKMVDEQADVGFAPSIHWSEKYGCTQKSVPDYKDSADLFSRWFSGNRTVNTCSVVWRSTYLRKIGGWDKKIERNQDGELALRAALLGARFSQSTCGAGVWVNDHSTSRVSTRIDTIDRLFAIEEKFKAMKSKFVTDEIRFQACAHYLHRVADIAYRAGADQVGAEAMARRRMLGFRDASGEPKRRFSVALRIVPKPVRARLWHVILAIKRRRDSRAVQAMVRREASGQAVPRERA